MPMTCLDDNVFAALIDGTLVGAARAEADQHLDQCGQCRSFLAHLAGQTTEGNRSIVSLRDKSQQPHLLTGATVGRFVLLNFIGEGGMGVVYAAFDPLLDRKVAVKILRSEAAETEAQELRARMTREARALARISHPNVVAVYEVGTVSEQIFITMEFADGGTLADWLKREKRSWREIVEHFSYAGRGLAAAHGAGLVHRDFKPENVLLRKDGRVCVSDFGLARHLGNFQVPVAALGPIEPATSDQGLTRASAIVGTPAYMAPEQLTGGSVDARSDQFAFCVALYEALYGERPFAADTPRALIEQMRAGRIRPVPSDRRVPPWIRQILVRGLSYEPADRFPAIEPLLRALRSDPRAALKTSAMVAGVLLLGAGAGLATSAVRGSSARACRGAEARLAGIWDADRGATIREAFLATGAPFAQDAWDRVRHGFDLYAQRWTATYTQACEATRVSGEQTEEVLGLRMDCLDQRLRAFQATVDILSNADAHVAEKASQAVASLPDLGVCDNVSVLRARLHVPNPDIRDEVKKLRARVAQARALAASGKYTEARSALLELVKPIQAVGYLPLWAEALQLLGDMQSRLDQYSEAEQTLRSAIRTAEELADDEVKARSLLILADLLNHGRSANEAEFDAELAKAAVERAGNPPLLKAFLEERMGLLYLRQQRYDEAIAHHRTALALWEKNGRTDTTDYAASLGNLGVALAAKGDLAGAAEHYVRTIAALKKAVGDSHPTMAVAYNNLANNYRTTGQLQKALDAERQSIAISERLQSAKPRSVALAYSNLGKIFLEMGNFSEGRKALEHQVDICFKAYGPNSSEVARTYWDLADYFFATKDYDRAGETLKKALALFRANSEQPAHVGGVTRDLGFVRVAQRRYSEANSLLLEALGLLTPALGKANPQLSGPLRALGEAQLGLGRPRQAAQSLRAALELHPERAFGPVELARTRFDLAKVLWALGQNRTQSISMAKEARQELGRVERSHATDEVMTEIDSWLAQHAGRAGLVQR